MAVALSALPFQAQHTRVPMVFGAYPITPSTQMGEGWAAAFAEGKRNVNGRRLLFFEPEGEHAAAAVTAGMRLRRGNGVIGSDPAKPDVVVAANGGSDLIYIPGRSAEITGKVVNALLAQD